MTILAWFVDGSSRCLRSNAPLVLYFPFRCDKYVGDNRRNTPRSPCKSVFFRLILGKNLPHQMSVRMCGITCQVRHNERLVCSTTNTHVWHYSTNTRTSSSMMVSFSRLQNDSNIFTTFFYPLFHRFEVSTLVTFGVFLFFELEFFD